MQERRKFIRLEKPVVVKYSHLGELKKTEEEFPGKNISPGGVCAVLREALQPQTLLNLRVYLPDNTFPIRIKGRVAWSKEAVSPSGEKLFETGIEFVEIDDLDFKKVNKYVNDSLPLPSNKG